MKSSALLLYAASEESADMLHLGKVRVPDAFPALVVSGRSIAVVNQLEFGRVREEGAFDEVLLDSDLLETHRKSGGKPSRLGRTVTLIRALASQHGIETFEISPEFPAGLAFALRRTGFGVQVAESGLFPGRAIKNEAEQEAIREGNRASAAGFAAAEALLREAAVRDGWLYHGGKRLTSERVRESIEIAGLRRNAVSRSVIVAGGKQACDPHCEGSGPLKADELIVVDIFPRVRSTGYHGDMTRTFLKGRASDAQRALVETVRAAQKAAISVLRAGVSGAAVHAAAAGVFDEKGYKTRRTDDGNYVGFFHGTGHGLGLEVHEEPRVSPRGEEALKTGAVVTIEPGLYYPEIGGVRIEDVFAVTDDGAAKLSSYPYRWEIP